MADTTNRPEEINNYFIYLVQRGNPHNPLLLGESRDENLVLEHVLGLPLQVAGDLNIVSWCITVITSV